MLAQYLTLLLNHLVINLGEIIDSGFANSISIGTICVFGIIASFKNILKAFYEYGMYYFRMTGIRAKAGLLLNIIVAVCFSAAFIPCAHLVKYIYFVEQDYEILLRNCIIIVFLFFPFEAASVYLADYLVFTKQEKLCCISNAVFYICMIIFDVVAVLIFHSAELVLIGTGICYVLYVIVIYIKSGIHNEIYKKGDLYIVLKGGLPLFCNRIVGKLCVASLSIIATRYEAVQYATFVVVRKALEVGQMCVYPLSPIGIIKMRGKNYTCREMEKKLKTITPIAMVMFMVVGMAAAVVMKGDLALNQVMPISFAVCFSSMITYYFFVIIDMKAMADGMPNVLNIMGISRLVSTIVLCMASLWIREGWMVLTFYSTIIDLVVAVCGYAVIRKGGKKCVNASHL